jgi:biotin carboxylase
MPTSKNIVLFVGYPLDDAFIAVEELSKHLKKKLRIAFVYSKKAKPLTAAHKKRADFLFPVDTKNLASVERTIMPIIDQVIVVNCRSVFYMPLYAKMITMFPHLVMPTRDSIEATSNKLIMRRKFRRYFPGISPKFTSAHGGTKEDVAKVKKYVGFPCVVKPASLAASRLVSICYHEEELASTLRKTFRGLKAAYNKMGALVEPEVIVEEFMEGAMYSIDSYVDNTGHVKHLPAVHVKTGQNIGVDDFYNYRVFTPTSLTEEQEKAAQDIASKSIRALGLRACIIHGEFIKLDEGWKVLEIDARMGGHRDLMYRESFGTPHGLNDLLTRMGEKPVIKRKTKKYTASFNIFPKKRGVIKSIKGIKKVRELDALRQLKVLKKVGDKAGLSKQGFHKILDITLSSPSRSELLAEIRRMEKAIEIKN